MDEAVTLAARTLEVEYSKIVEILPGGGAAAQGWGGLERGARRRGEGAAGEGSEAGFTLRSEEPVIMEDLSTEERSDPLCSEAHGVVSGISVVIHGRRGTLWAVRPQ